MPVFKYNALHLDKVEMEGVRHVSRTIVLGRDEGWDGYALRVFRLDPGGFTPRHQHDWEHVNHVIKGRGRLRLGDKVHEIREHDFAFVPPNTEHQFENPYDEPFEFICIVPDRGEYPE
jgi:quercetin dioxygenase-like cupin family protein